MSDERFEPRAQQIVCVSGEPVRADGRRFISQRSREYFAVPMLDATIPAGALSPRAEEKLLNRLTDVLLEHEGVDPTNPIARSIAWIFVHRPAQVFVAGKASIEPRYRFVVSVPEGQLDDDRRRGIVEAVTKTVLDAEAGSYPRDPGRVWVMTNEIPDGTWGAYGRIMRLEDIATLVLGDAERGRQLAEHRLRLSRRSRAAAMV